MAEYLLLMHDDATGEGMSPWDRYIQGLKDKGVFEGGSAIGEGVCVRKDGTAPPITAHLGGYIRVSAQSLAHAQSLLAGNPHFEAGGTVEIGDLPREG